MFTGSVKDGCPLQLKHIISCKELTEHKRKQIITILHILHEDELYKFSNNNSNKEIKKYIQQVKIKII